MKEIYQRVMTCSKFMNTKIVLSGFDFVDTFETQLDKILKLTDDFPDAIVSFLVKLNFSVNSLLKSIEQAKERLSALVVIGVTEKEIGSNIHERLLNLIRIKRQLFDCGWHGLTHVFGGLEQNLVKLYYLAGADIFDGLSWQRIRYRNNSTLFDPSNYYISLDENENKYLMMIDNLAVLHEMSNELAPMSGDRLDYMSKLESLLNSGNYSIGDLLMLLGV